MSSESPSIFQKSPNANSAAPAWLQSLHAESWQAAQALPMPSRKNEAWRFADLGQLDFAQFVPAVADSGFDAVAASCGLENSAGRIIFVNDVLVHMDAALQQVGVSIVSLAEAPAGVQDAVMAAKAQPGSEKLLALHQAHVREAAVILVAAGSEIAAPIEIFHWASGQGASVFPCTILQAGRNAKVSVLEHHRSVGTESHFSCGVTQLLSAEGGKIDYILSQQRSATSKSVHFSSTRCAKDSQILHCQLNLGSAWTRHECVSHMDGSGGRSDMLGVSLTDGEQEADNRTLQLHHAPHAQSDLLYKNVLFGKSRNIFAGLIVVDDGAHFTDAYQTCRNMLMSDDCEANAMPGLEINADQVKCSHGSTSGAIDTEEIFYLQSRGIEENAAKSLLAEGFLAQTLERISNEPLRTYLLAQVAQRFASALKAA